MRRGILNVTLSGSIFAACLAAGACGPIGSDGSTSLAPEAAAPVPDTGTPAVDAGTAGTDSGTSATDSATGGDATGDAIVDSGTPAE
jgi:hypothetical protein